MRGLTLRMLQERYSWGDTYNSAFRSSPVAHKDFSHAKDHVMKALGKLAAMVEEADHEGGTAAFSPWEVSKYLADIVICAARMANTIPGGHVDLEKAVIDRTREKTGMRLDTVGE